MELGKKRRMRERCGKEIRWLWSTDLCRRFKGHRGACKPGKATKPK